MALVVLRDVQKTYPQSGGSLPVLKNINLELTENESLAIVGPSGSGKSTLLHIIGTLDAPTSGEVILDGQPVQGLAERQLAFLRSEKIGFVFQAHYLLPQCTALENVLVPTLALPADRRPAALDRAKKLLHRVGLSNRSDHRPAELSGGEKQRVAVVRALINKPKVLLADEPTGALDRAASDQLGTLLVDLNREEQTALVVVTHSMELARRMGRILELRDGQLLQAQQL